MKRATRIIGLICLLAAAFQSGTAAAAADSTDCFHALQDRLSGRQEISILRVDGTSLKARFLRVDADSQTLVVESYDSAVDRRVRRQVPRSNLSRIEWNESRGIPPTALLGGLILGGLGLAAGLSFSRDTDAGTRESRERAPYLLGLGGVSIGYLLGNLLGPGDNSRLQRIDCALTPGPAGR